MLMLLAPLSIEMSKRSAAVEYSVEAYT